MTTTAADRLLDSLEDDEDWKDFKPMGQKIKDKYDSLNSQLNDFDKKFFTEGFADLKKSWEMHLLQTKMMAMARLDKYIDELDVEVTCVKSIKRSRDDTIRKAKKARVLE